MARFRNSPQLAQQGNRTRREYNLGDIHLVVERLDGRPLKPPTDISHPKKEPMKTSKIIVVSHLLLTASLLVWGARAFAQQPKPEESVKADQLSDADEKAIREIIKGLETAWNKHDMKAFTKSFRDDAEGINVVGMDWIGKRRC